jgi:hypothetical protein
MSTVHLPRREASVLPRPIAPLENGDRLSQATYHERNEAMPAGIRAEARPLSPS